MKQNQSSMVWLLLSLHLLLFHFPSFTSLCHQEENYALLQFKSSFTINTNDYSCDEPLMKTTTWKNEIDCCSWHGVTCDNISGHVIGLNLGCEGLEGIIHPNSTLFRLAHLQSLNLSHNNFFGSHFHSKFGGFLSLKHLDLSDSTFQGVVPPQISHLSKLESLHLSENDELVWKKMTLKRFVLNSTNLRELFLDSNDLSSIRPSFIHFLFNKSSSLVTLNLVSTGLRGNLTNNFLCLSGIQDLDLSLNYELHGQLHELSCSSSLTILDLSDCQFKGPIPSSFSNLTHLTSLTLSYNHLYGSIPSSLLTLPRLTFLYLDNNELSGQIPNAFQMSNKFQELDLHGNKFGGELPTSLFNLKHLIYMDLSYNLFSSQIPNVFGGMTKLRELRLGSNNFEGQIPSSLLSLTQLLKLDCSYNKLEGLLPDKTTGFQKLTDLFLNDNLLNGTIPPWCLSLPSLQYLYLQNNRFSGHIGEISSHSLEILDLLNNRLQGNIPESIFNLANLTTLYLSSNNLSGVVNFQLFSKLTSLLYLSLSHNSQLSLNFESNVSHRFPSISQLELSAVNLIEFSKLEGEFPNLQSLDLSNNKLNGRMPNWLREIFSLMFLDLSQNLFTSIDQLIQIAGKSGGLKGLDLSFNLLHGNIPFSVCNLSSLEFLNLRNNHLTGTIPQCLANLSSLGILDLQMNTFYGTLPSNFSKESELHTLNLYGNQLEGHLPKSLSHCKHLKILNLASNKIEGNFPNWLQTLQYLKVLVLRDNKLDGSISNLKIKHPFTSLVVFDISGNNFSGPLPRAYLNNFKAMMNGTQVKEDASLSYMEKDMITTRIHRGVSYGVEYYDSMTVTMKGTNMAMVKISKLFVSIDFSRNKFSGEIPNTIGELHALIGLNLSHNTLTGHMPQSIGNLTNLESLDLSSNMLTGVIPKELSNLDFLEVLNLSNNNLVGEIPQGPHLSTFSNDSYEGNSRLCGFPLSKNCRPVQHPPPSPNSIFWSEEKFGFGWKPVAVGYGCGFVIGIGLGYIAFLIGKPRWLVMIFGGQPKRRVKRRTRLRRNNGSAMSQMVQMS